MPLFIVSTVRRRCPADEPSGYIYVIDPHQRRVVQRSSIVEPLYRELDNNPRGGMRGGKGISVRPDQIALANFSFIQRYDPQWNLLGVITHPSCAGIHDIYFDSDSLWVAAARADLLMQFNLAGTLIDYIYLRQPSPAIAQLGWKPPVLLVEEQILNGEIDFRHPQSVEKETYDRAHVNSLCRLPDGDLLVSLGFVFDDRYASLLRLKIRLIQWGIWPALKALNRGMQRALGKRQKNMDQNLVVKPVKAQSALVRINPEGERTLILKMNHITAPSHSLLALEDGSVVYLNTTDGTVLHIDPNNCRALSTTQVATGGFLRGVTPLDAGRLLVGNRGEIIVFDLPARTVQDRIVLTNDPNEAVYDIKELPAHYALPPLSFSEHFTRQTGLTSPQELYKHPGMIDGHFPRRAHQPVPAERRHPDV
jgi:hypothetical protein